MEFEEKFYSLFFCVGYLRVIDNLIDVEGGGTVLHAWCGIVVNWEDEIRAVGVCVSCGRASDNMLQAWHAQMFPDGRQDHVGH